MTGHVAGVSLLILAAGASSRMRGADKLLQPVGGVPQLRRLAQAALATGRPVLVALPATAGPRQAALDGLAITPVPVPDAAQGMGRSLAAGAAQAAITGARALMILPADMPLIDRAAITTALAAAAADPDRIWRATTPTGTPGHPVIFPARLFTQLQSLRDDTGARSLLAAEPPRTFALAGETATLDLDTPEAWAAYRSAYKDP